MTKKVRAGIFFGISMAVYLTIQSLLMKDDVSSKIIIKSVIAGLIGGFIGGFLYGWLTDKYASPEKDKTG